MNLTQRYRILQQKQLYEGIAKIHEIMAKANSTKTKPSKEESEMIQTLTIMIYGANAPKNLSTELEAMIG